MLCDENKNIPTFYLKKDYGIQAIMKAISQQAGFKDFAHKVWLEHCLVSVIYYYGIYYKVKHL